MKLIKYLFTNELKNYLLQIILIYQNLDEFSLFYILYVIHYNRF